MKVFGDVLVRTQAFLDNGNMDFKKCKNGIFPKGMVHDFGQNFEILLTFRFNQNTTRKRIW